MSETPARIEPALRHFPAPLFAAVMGLSGLTLAWRANAPALGLSGQSSLPLALLSAAVFVLIAGAYLTKAVRHPDAVAHEFAHPVRVNFFPAMTISLLLLAMIALPWLPLLALGLFAVGATGHLLLTLLLMSRWIADTPMPAEQINPAWFIPVVGNILVPLPAVQLGFVDLAWLFFSIGAVFWAVLFTLVFQRLVSAGPLPARLLPTLAILLAPPSVGLLSWLALNGGVLDAPARLFYGIASFLFLLLAFQLPRMHRLPFFLSWWAWSFPLAAYTLATHRIAELSGAAILHLFALALLTLTTLVVLALGLTTVREALAGRICVPE